MPHLKPQTTHLILSALRSIIIIAIRNNYYLPRWVGSLEPARDWGFSQEPWNTKDKTITHKCLNTFAPHPSLGSTSLGFLLVQRRPNDTQKVFDCITKFLAFLKFEGENQFFWSLQVYLKIQEQMRKWLFSERVSWSGLVQNVGKMKGVNKQKAESLFGGGLCTTLPVYSLAYLFISAFKILRQILGPHLQFFLVSLLGHRRDGLHILCCFSFLVLSYMKCLSHKHPPCLPQGVMKANRIWCSLTSVVLTADTVPAKSDTRHRRKRIRTSHSCRWTFSKSLPGFLAKPVPLSWVPKRNNTCPECGVSLLSPFFPKVGGC